MQSPKPATDLPPHPTDDDLVVSVLQGEQHLFEELVRRYQSDVQRIAAYTLRDRNSVEDLVQQVFLSVYTHLGDFQPGRNLGSWIRTIARNAVREDLRRNSRYDRRLAVYSEFVAASIESGDFEQQDQLVHDSLQECLRQLPAAARQLVDLRYREEKSFAEIAGMLGTAAGAVRNRLSRIRGKLRECIDRKAGSR